MSLAERTAGDKESGSLADPEQASSLRNNVDVPMTI